MTKITPNIAKLTKFNYPIERKWYLLDIANKPLGRVVTKISELLIGKHKPYYSLDRDCGDYVIVLNAGKILLTGKKLQQKFLFRHSGYLGGKKFIPYSTLIPKKADLVLKEAVKGMLPKNKLRAKRLKRLKVFIDEKWSINRKDIVPLKV